MHTQTWKYHQSSLHNPVKLASKSPEFFSFRVTKDALEAKRRETESRGHCLVFSISSHTWWRTLFLKFRMAPSVAGGEGTGRANCWSMMLCCKADRGWQLLNSRWPEPWKNPFTLSVPLLENAEFSQGGRFLVLLAYCLCLLVEIHQII